VSAAGAFCRNPERSEGTAVQVTASAGALAYDDRAGASAGRVPALAASVREGVSRSQTSFVSFVVKAVSH